MRNIVTAIHNRDGGMLARMAGDAPPPQGKGVHEDVEHLVNLLFSNLKQLFPASVSTVLKDPQAENFAKKQWIASFAENGITNKALIQAGMKYARASESPFWPSPGQFVAWCRQGEAIRHGLPDADELYNMVMGYSAKRGLYSSAEAYPWSSNPAYWMVTKLYSLMRSLNLSSPELRKHCETELKTMARRIESGESIPAPVVQIPKLHIPISNERGLDKIAELRAKLGLKKGATHD